MSYIEADCSLIKKNGRLVGLSLVAQPQSEAEIFCNSMPKQLVEGSGNIKLGNGKLTFVNSNKDEVSFAISDDDATAVHELLTGKNGELEIHRDGFFTPGFRIVRAGQKEGERISLKRV